MENGGGAKSDSNYFHNAYKAANGDVTPTGVSDMWPYCIAGLRRPDGCERSAGHRLRRKEEDLEDTVLAEDDGDE